MSYSDVKYDLDRQTVLKLHDSGATWEEIKSIVLDESKREIAKIYGSKDESDWDNIIKLVRDDVELKDNHAKSIENGIIRDKNENNGLSVPKTSNSTWQLFRKKIEEKGIKNLDIIENDVFDIVKSTSTDTYDSDPIKGLVVGNVQSGKTNNIEGLIAMAADNGYNVFIILAGAISNLRTQTKNRLTEDLLSLGGTNLEWQYLDLNSKESVYEIKNLQLGEHKKRFIVVVLKNSKRLSELNKWAVGGSLKNPEYDKMKNMKVIVIDDEADQASIDTRDISDDERSKINSEIVKLVNNKKFGAMNYVGYTATPYANVLNENREESLYPKNFIKVLYTSKSYFGPKQIFGYLDAEIKIDDTECLYKGLNIVNNVDSNDLDAIEKIIKGSSGNCSSLYDAICWFLCTAAFFRFKKCKKPVTMLVHISNLRNDHEIIAKNIEKTIETHLNTIISDCEKVYERECNKFKKIDLYEGYPDYEISDVEELPKFSNLKNEIQTILSDPITAIKLDEERKPIYDKKGIHLCIDNSSKNAKSSDLEIKRLIYPSDYDKLAISPIFIVVGGNTLSRGLTIDGLTTSYFIRQSNYADTLMQMGRWFGYRKGYELCQRIWLTNKTKEAFKELTRLEEELKYEFYTMQIKGLTPNDYGPKVRVVSAQITAKNKMQSAVNCEYDYSSSILQTFKFDRDKNIIEQNFKIANDFVNKISNNKKRIGNNFIFTNVKFDDIKNFINSFHINSRIRALGEKKPFLEWLEKCNKKNIYSGWNVVIDNKLNGDAACNVGDIKVNMCNRSAIHSDKDSFNIGTLSDPLNFILDIEVNDSNSQLISNYKNSKKILDLNEVRRISGLDKTPQLTLYFVNPKSTVRESSKKRTSLRELNLGENPISGFAVYLPGEDRSTKKYAQKVSIPIDRNLNDDDIEA